MTGLSDSIKDYKDHFIKSSKISSINKVLALFGFNIGKQKEYIVMREDENFRFDAYSFFTSSGDKRLMCLWVDKSFNIKDSALFSVHIPNLTDLRSIGNSVPSVEDIQRKLNELSNSLHPTLLLRHKF